MRKTLWRFESEALCVGCSGMDRSSSTSDGMLEEVSIAQPA